MSKQLNKDDKFVQIQVRLLPKAYDKVCQAIEVLKNEGVSTSRADFCRNASIEKAEKIIKRSNNVSTNSK